MARFHVYRNLARRGEEDTPYLLDVQADLLSALRTRVVVPLRSSRTVPRPARHLQPRFVVAGAEVVMDTPAIVGAPVSALGEEVADLRDEAVTIRAALDFLLTGI